MYTHLSKINKNSENLPLDILIIGAGISGLSLGFYLKKEYKYFLKKKLSFCILESNNRVGGKLYTEKQNNCLIEHAADCFLNKQSVIDLIKDLKAEKDVITYNKKSYPLFIMKNQKLIKMPEGMMFSIPTKFMPFLNTPLLSIRGKLRIACDLFIARSNKEDNSISNFILHRLGKEALDYLAEPILSGIYNVSPETQSLQSTVPLLLQMEKKYRSLILGTIIQYSRRKKKNIYLNSMFLSFKEGMYTLPKYLYKILLDNIKLNITVKNIRKESNYYIVETNNGSFYTNNIVLATSASITYNICNSLGNESKITCNKLKEIKFIDSASLYIAYSNKVPSHFSEALGIIIPRIEKKIINAITICSNKFDFRTNKNLILLRVSLGGARNPNFLKKNKNKEIIISLVIKEINNIFSINEKPIFMKFIYHKDNPQYEVNHKSKIINIANTISNNLYIIGSSYYGIGVSDCIAYSNKICKTILTKIKKSSNI